MRRVLIPLFEQEEGFSIQGARDSYIKKVIKYNLLPIFISPLMTYEMIEILYNEAGGALFMGGADWDPALYGKEKHEKTHVTEPNRDKIELFVLKKCLQDKKPILAICRGCQGLAIANGGTLMQHVPEHVQQEEHFTIKTYTDLLTSQKHPIFLDPESLAYKLLQKREILVNSAHHQAVENPGAGMKIVARSPEGIAEIIESTDPSFFCIGVQSHPEIEEESFLEELFVAFAEAVRA